MSTQTDLLIARNGGIFTDGTLSGLTSDDNYIYFVANDDTVIASMASSGDADMVASWAIGSKVVGKGMIIAAQDGAFITAISLTSGSGFLIKG